MRNEKTTRKENMSNFNYNGALDKFVETIRVNSLEYYKKAGITHLVENPVFGFLS